MSEHRAAPPDERRMASDGGGHADGHEHGHAGELRPGWSRPKPEHVPRPTYWPAVLAFGITFLLWGIITTYIISAIGIVLMGIAIGGWIGDLKHGDG